MRRFSWPPSARNHRRSGKPIKGYVFGGLGVFLALDFFGAGEKLVGWIQLWGLDKILHLGAFSVLTLVLLSCVPENQNGRRTARRWLVFGAMAAFGTADELLQSLLPNRNADIWDWAADMAAILLSGTLGLAWKGWQARRHRQLGGAGTREHEIPQRPRAVPVMTAGFNPFLIRRAAERKRRRADSNQARDGRGGRMAPRASKRMEHAG